MAEMRKDLVTLQAQSASCSEILADVKEAMVEHKVRLENGSKVFDGIRSRLATVEEATRPKPPSIVKIVGVTLAVVGMGAGALWGLSNMLRDRPTLRQVEKVIDAHDDNGHKETRIRIEEIREEQVEQRTLIKHVESQVGTQGDKLDEILERVPKRRRPR
jgi:hypothetical protein